MKTISIYNNSINNNKDRREFLANKIKENGFSTGRDGDYLFVLGGDGTFLKAIQRNMRENPVFIGINTGNLGYLSEFRFDDVDEIFDMIKKRNYWLQTIPIYEAIITTKEQLKRMYFVNDIVIERKSTRIIHSEIFINDGKFATLSGDGLIISSSLGSTGYGIAAGGAISYDCDDVMQMTPLHPVNTSAYRSLMKSVILKSSNEITIYPNYKKQRSFRIACDGNEVKYRDIRSVTIKKSPFSVRILRSKKYNTIDNLKVKILEND